MIQVGDSFDVEGRGKIGLQDDVEGACPTCDLKIWITNASALKKSTRLKIMCFNQPHGEMWRKSKIFAT